MLSRSNWLILGLAVLVAAFGGYLQHRGEPATATPGAIGQALPALSLPDLDGKLHTLNEYRGHRVLLNFWASWCVPCLKEMPALAEVQAKFGKNEPIVIGIAMDEPDRVRAFLAAHPVNYPILLGDTDVPSTSMQVGNITQVLPFSVLIGADGRILATHAGALSSTQLAQWLAPAAE